MTQKGKCLNYYVLFQDSSLSPTLEYMPNYDLWVYDQELGLYWLNRVAQLQWTSSTGIVPLTSSFACF